MQPKGDIAMTKQSKTKTALSWFVFLTGLVGLIGATMAIFEIPYGEKIALTGAVWFAASFVTAMLVVATEMSNEEDKELEKEIVQLKRQIRQGVKS